MNILWYSTNNGISGSTLNSNKTHATYCFNNCAPKTFPTFKKNKKRRNQTENFHNLRENEKILCCFC